MGSLSNAEKRKYALALRRVDYGIWGYARSVFRVVTLTTREGDDNSTRRMGKSIKKLIAWMRKLGYGIEYCGVFELSPGKGLLHWHGILRVKGGYFPVTRRMLGDKWNEIHNAFVVDLAVVKNISYLERYINKHMVKDYLSEGVIRNKFLVSRGWMRSGISELIVDFKKWWVNVTGDIWVSNAGWLLLKTIIRRYCENKNVLVGGTSGHFGLSGGRVDAEIYSFEEV